jgi:isopentenyl-diphosphate delta-isomerase type 1
VDEADHVLGSITRVEAHSGSNKIHRAASVLIFTPDHREVLLQQRSLQKDMCPGYWADSVGGHVSYGQTYEEAVIRETQEELGLVHLPLTFHSKHLFNLEGEREFYAIYLAALPKHTPIHFYRDEIQQVQWLNVADIPSLFRTKPCTLGVQQSWGKVQVGFPV